MKLLSFMSIKQAREFYLKIKEYFDDEIFENFYVYFELTWLNTYEKETVKFDFNLWSYYEKFYFKRERNKFLISKQLLDKYIFVSKNYCESLKNLISNFIQDNSKISLNMLDTIIKILFARI